MNEFCGYAFDERWCGDHGIGRFAKEVGQRVDGLKNANFRGGPSDALDPLRTGVWLYRNPGERLFTPGYNAPFFGRSRSVITVHDLNHIDVIDGGSRLKNLYYSRVLKPACRQAFCVLTVSEFSRQRIIEWSGAGPKKVVNVGNGISDVFKESSDMDVSISGSPYFLCVSNRKPHKNEIRLLEAFSKARISEKVMLLMSGDRSPNMDRYIDRLQLGARVKFLGRTSDVDLAKFYRSAIALLFPSLYEGFGLPVVEAMACGTPVLTSKVTSLPEIAGGAAYLVDPYSVSEIQHGIERLEGDASLCARLKKAGLERAKSFSWDQVARRVRSALSKSN